MTSGTPPTIDDVRAAARRLAGVVRRTPVLRSAALDAAVGATVLIKPENLQETGSFKLRGAYNALSLIPEQDRATGVAAFSSGNHAQGVARAAKLLSMPAAIVMPHDAPAIKAARARADGAEIIGYDRLTADREALAAALAKERGATLIPSYDHPDVIAGQGTAGLELAEDAKAMGAHLDAVFCCAGGGGLIAGVGLGVRSVFPDTGIIACEPVGFEDHGRSLKAGERVANEPDARSICDALLAPTPGALTWRLNRSQLTGAASVSDEQVRAAMAFAFRELKLVVEPGGAAALAAVLSGAADAYRGGAIGVILTGGNVDPEVFAKAIGAA